MYFQNLSFRKKNNFLDVHVLTVLWWTKPQNTKKGGKLSPLHTGTDAAQSWNTAASWNKPLPSKSLSAETLSSWSNVSKTLSLLKTTIKSRNEMAFQRQHHRLGRIWGCVWTYEWEHVFSHIQDTLIQQNSRLNSRSKRFCVSLVWLNTTFLWQWSGIQH